MDFVFSTDARDRNAIKSAFREAGYSSDDMRESNGFFTWGTYVATDSPYRSYQPLTKDAVTYVVLGDPLLGNVPSPASALNFIYNEACSRTSSVADVWEEKRREGGHPEPYHPSALLRIDHRNKTVEIVTDAWAAVPLFYRIQGTSIMIATSPDLIACVATDGFDSLSAKELLATGQISYPHTLYLDIKQVAPGAFARFAGTYVSVSHWWRPPLPDTARTLDEWREAIHGAICEGMRRIRAEVGPAGTTTLSAGADSRYVAALGAQNDRLDLAAVTMTAAPNLESWIARRVAERLRIPLVHRIRKKEHYTKTLLSRPIQLTTQLDWRHAHFYDHALGQLPKDAFLLGAYMADTLFAHGGPLFRARRKAFQRGVLDASAPRWATNELWHRLSAEDAAAIEERWQRADDVLHVDERHSKNLRCIFPSIRQGRAQLAAARRSYPMYELFMTSAALEIGFQLPDALKEAGPKERFLGNDIDCLKDIPVNPTKSRRARKMLEAYKAIFPEELWPDCVRYSGAWVELTGASRKQLSAELAAARNRVTRILNLEIPKRQTVCRLSFQIQCAMDIAER